MTVKNVLKILIKVAISCGFFYVLLSFIETNELATLFTQVDWLYFGLSFVVTLVMLLASCLKWKVILDLKEKKVPFLSLLKVYFIGYFFSNLLPSTIGGDVIRSYYVGEKIQNHAHSAVAIFIERFSGILFLFFLAIVAPLFHIELYSSPYVIVPALGGMFFLTVTIFVWKAENPMKVVGSMRNTFFAVTKKISDMPLLGWTKKGVLWFEDFCIKIESKLQKLRDELTHAVVTIKRDRLCFTKIVLLTIFFYFLTWINVYFGFRAFGIKPDFLLVCALTPTIMFAAHLPVTLLGNIGYFESIFVFYFLLVGIPAEHSLAMGLLLRVKTLTMGVIGFVVYALYKKEQRDKDGKGFDEVLGNKGSTET